MTKTKTKNSLFGAAMVILVYAAASLLWAPQASAARKIIYPVIGKSSYINDFYYTRTLRGKTVRHNATDIIAKKGQSLVAAVNGTIIDVQYPEPDWGFSVTIRDAEGYRYSYLHLNDDTPGTNDGAGGGMRAYAADIREGAKVAKGQLLGRVGDSGFANGIPHLHFEMKTPEGKIANPYATLKAAKKISKPVVEYPRAPSEIVPHGSVFRGGASITMGNIDADADAEIIIGAGPGGRLVKIFDLNGVAKSEFSPNDPKFLGGIDVVAGDIDEDNVDEIITGSGPGGSYVKIFDASGSQIRRFAPYGTGHKAGINVALGDIDGDGDREIITGSGPGSTPRVGIFEIDGTPVSTFAPFELNFRGGVNVTAGDLFGGPDDEIIIGSGPGSTPIVRVFSEDGTRLDGYHPYLTTFRGGVKVEVLAAANEVSKDEVITTGQSNASPRSQLFSATGSPVRYYPYVAEVWWRGFYDTAAYEDKIYTSLGQNRRTSIRQVDP